MLIKVVFKKSKEKGYEEQKFTYRSIQKVEVNDIVVVETRYGLAIAKVVEVDVTDSMFSEDNLKSVFTILIKEKDRLAKEEEKRIREAQIQTFVDSIRRNRIKTALENAKGERLNIEESEFINTLTDEELNKFFKNV